MTQPTLLVLAGPNGAGKTTFAYSHLKDYISAGLFLNADETARDMSPGNVELAALAAGRQVLERRRHLIAAGDSFCVETTLATRTLVQAIRQARTRGYLTRLYFLFVSSPSLCQFRVKLRVMKGGHNIPDDVVHRRHAQGLRFLSMYVAACDDVEIFHADETPIQVLERSGGASRIADSPRFDMLQAAIRIAGGAPIAI